MTITDVDPRIVDSTIVDADVIESDFAPDKESDSDDVEAVVYDAVKADLAAGANKGGDRSLTEATFSVTQAAEACLVSRKTIVRRLPQLEEFGAWKDSQGQWVIPLSALLAADLRPGRPSRPEQEQPKAAPVEPTPVSAPPRESAVVNADPSAVTALRAEIADWQRRANDAEKRAAVAEAIATERAGRVDDLRLALRQLEPVRTVPAQVIEEQQPKRGWRRFF